MATVVITGGAGFIGSTLTKRLIQDGYSVICIDNLLTGSRANIVDLEGKPGFHFLEADVSSLDTSGMITEKIDAVFHLASPASPNKNSPKSYLSFPIETLLVNSLGTCNMLELAREHKATFLYTSSSEIYGDPLQSPQTESYFGNVNPVGIRSVYDEGKRFGEAMTMAFFRKYHLNIRIVRIFNTFGPHMQKDDGRVVSNFINQALSQSPITIYGDGSQTRSFCFVDDMVEGLMRGMFSEGTEGKFFNLGNPDERTIKQIAELIKEKTTSQSEIIHQELPEDDPKRRKPDISKAKALLDWTPKVSLEEGLDKTIAYFRTL